MKKIALFVLAILSSLGCLAGDSVEVWFQNVAVPQGGAAEMVVRWDNQADNLLYHGDGYHGDGEFDTHSEREETCSQVKS